MRFVTALLLAALWFSGGALADDSAKKKIAPYWIKSQTGCEIWNSQPEPNETVTWSGPCVNGKAHGRGRLVWYANGVKTSLSRSVRFNRGKDVQSGYEDTTYFTEDGKFDGRYRGQFRDGDFNGKGRYDYANGDRYIGQWKDGEINGRGTFTWKEGDRHTGEWKDGKEHGKGVQRLANGSTYRGDFVNGKRHGYGTYIARNPKGIVARYDGQFRDDQVHGFAVKVQGRGSDYTGQKYIGYFKDGKVHGAGTATALDGSFFTGHYRDGKKWSGRRYLAKHGKIWTWKDGKQIEPGEPYKK